MQRTRFVLWICEFWESWGGSNCEIWTEVCSGVISLSFKLYYSTFRVLGLNWKLALLVIQKSQAKPQYIVNSLFLSLTFAGISRWVIENSYWCVFLGVFYLLRDWVMFVAGGCWSTLVVLHKHLSRGSGVKEECRGAEVHMQTFLWIISCSGSDCSLCLEIIFFSAFTFFYEVKMFPVSSQQACMSLQKFVEKERTFIIFFLLEEWIAKMQ